MKNTNLFLLSAMILSGISITNANASHIYANTITAHNIAAIQHAITHTAFNSFEGAMPASLNEQRVTAQKNKQAPQETASLYGRASIYGEYDDSALTGRSGGDAEAALNSIWFSWEHIGDNVKFDNFSSLDSDFDLVMMGLSGGVAKMGNGITQWGIYTGYVGGTQQNDFLDIDEQGGYFGLYNGFNAGRFNLSTSINGGALDNSAENEFDTDDFTNFWVGAIANATYDISLDDTFTIQPGIQVGYTWIKSENYTSASGDVLKNDAFGMLEVSPTLRAIKHIGNGWHGALNVKHIMIYTHGGELTVNGTPAPELEMDDFTEYTLSLEKSVANVIFTANFGRRDGAHNGWVGGTNIKFRF